MSNSLVLQKPTTDPHGSRTGGRYRLIRQASASPSLGFSQGSSTGFLAALARPLRIRLKKVPVACRDGARFVLFVSAHPPSTFSSSSLKTWQRIGYQRQRSKRTLQSMANSSWCSPVLQHGTFSPPCHSTGASSEANGNGAGQWRCTLLPGYA